MHLASRAFRKFRVAELAKTRRYFSGIDIKEDSVSISSLSASYPFVWLRDSCQCASCIHPTTRQKLHRSSDIPLSIKPADQEGSIQAIASPEGLKVEWSAQVEGGKTHQSFYPAEFLRRHSSPSRLSNFHRDVAAHPWTAERFSNLTKDELLIPYDDLSDRKVLSAVYTQLLRDGLVFLKDVPTSETSNETCELRTLAGELGDIRRTFYGETWDVRNVRNSKNIAYTNLNLGLHMDLLYVFIECHLCVLCSVNSRYFKEPPRYQILHCLRNRVIGGQSIFVDAMQAALQLYHSSPNDFALLATTPVKFQYVNDGHHLHCSHPTFQLERTEGSSFILNSINYSPPFQGPLALSTPPEFYQALERYTQLLEDPDNGFSYLLREGDAVIFDNRRVLHGRTAFSEHEGVLAEEGSTSRWLKGCYLEEEPVLDKMRMLGI